MARGTNKYVGVFRDGNRFRSKIYADGVAHDLGRWPTELEGVIARDRTCLFLGLTERLQVPDKSVPLGPKEPELLRADARRAGKSPASKYIGVFLSQNRWVARLHYYDKFYHAGSFQTQTEAAVAYDRMVLFYKGKNRR